VKTFLRFAALIAGIIGSSGGSLPATSQLARDQTDGSIRFFAMGDTGTGRPDQYRIGGTLFEHCQREGCDFGVLLGDNFYPSGVVSDTDPQWVEKFEHPYADLLNASVKFYAVLGNHDYDDSKDLSRGVHQVKYGQRNSRWIMPDERYAFDAGQATFIALNTELINSSESEMALAQSLVKDKLAESDKPWKIALGHHPYRSNGTNGNAAPALAKFFEEHVCSTIDLYLSGHDHNLQILKPDDACQTLLVVAGGGGYETYALPGTHPSHFQAQSLGFAYLTVTAETLRIDMVNDSRRVLFTHRVEKKRKANR